MLNKKHIVIFQQFAVMLVLVVTTLTVSAHGFGRMDDDNNDNMYGQSMRGQYGGMMAHGMGMMNIPDMDGKQRSSFRSMMRKQRSENYSMMAEMMDIRDELADAMSEETVDAEKVDKLYMKLFEKKRQMAGNAIILRNKMHGMLNEEQKEWLKKNRGNYRMMEDSGDMMPRGGPMDN